MNSEPQGGASVAPGPSSMPAVERPGTGATAGAATMPQSSAPQAPSPVVPPPYAAPPAYYAPPGYPERPKARTTRWAPWLIGGVVAVVVLGLLAVVAIAALVASWTAGGLVGVTQTEVMTRQFTVSGAPGIVVRDASGTITIQQGAAGTISVNATKVVKTINGSAAQNALRNTTISMSQTGNTVTVNSQFQTSWFDGISSQRRVDMVITVPAGTVVETHLSAGTLTMTGSSATAVLDVSAGTIRLQNVTLTGNSSLSVSAGNVTADATLTSGASLTVNVSAGNAMLTLPTDTPAHLSARTSVGTVTISGWPITVQRGSVTGQSADGDLGANVRGNVTVTVSTGNIGVTAQ